MSKSGSSTFWNAVSTGIRLYIWKTNPTWRARQAVSFAPDMRVISSPATVTLPADGTSPSRAMATTLTLAIVVWPWAYVVQVGDSRCYHYWDGALQQVTRDQTVAQDLVDSGVLKPERAATSPFSRVLASSIGGDEASPVLTRLDIRQRGCVLLLCSDGLTTHVSDAEIAAQARTMESSEQLCRSLLDLALERGGTDNITVVVGRARGRGSQA